MTAEISKNTGTSGLKLQKKWGVKGIGIFGFSKDEYEMWMETILKLWWKNIQIMMDDNQA